MKRIRRTIGVAAAAGLAVAGCGTMTVNPIVQFVDDTATTTAIKTRLATEAGLGSVTAVKVHTADDMVWLTGTVASDEQRQRVDAIARRIAGDNRVVDQLTVAGNPSAEPTAQK